LVKVSIICIGKLKDAFFEDASKEYLKRLSAYCQTNIIEIPAASLPQEPSDALIQRALSAEAEAIMKKIPDKARVISLCIEGKELSSEGFAEKLESFINAGAGEICFIIGGSHGLSDEVKARSDFKLSFSKMTFPHRLARIMLLEQLYRAFSISTGGKYHK
jgi:23S rRNA (pseudouridine1915-N3)-methyltransferase